MQSLTQFLQYLCGTFSNEEQLKEQLLQGKLVHPEAKHVNEVCNDKIKNLPANFEGYFVLEESYYHNNNAESLLPHLFLFTQNPLGQIVLESYELPNGYRKEEFTNNNPALQFDYHTLKKSEKFTPLVYSYTDGCYEGESHSDFSHGVEFILKERVEPDTIYVSETFLHNGVLTFGFEEPIRYERQKPE